MRIDLNGLSILLISGTASIDNEGKTVHVGDLRAQTRRTFDGTP
jgi:enamine deaminase RidA (YjgF/YER057c/UK114 family)